MNTLDFRSVALPLGLLLGAIMNVVVLRTAWKRTHPRKGEDTFRLLVVATFLYDLCAFLSLFSTLVYINPAEIRDLTRIFDAGLLIGLAFIPSFLLQTAIPFFKPGVIPRWVYPLSFLPVLSIKPAMGVFWADSLSIVHDLEELLGPFSILLASVSTFASYFAYRISRKDRRPTTAQLTTAMSITLALVAILYLVTYALEGHRWPNVGPYLHFLGLLAPNTLSIGLALYVYRYPDVGDALQRGFYNMSLALLVLCLYFFGIREVAQKLGQLQLNWEVVEALMLVALVWAFHPLRSLAQNLYDGVFLRQVVRYQETFRRLGRGLSEAYVPDIPFVLSQAAGVIQEALSAEKAAIYLVANSSDGPQVTASHPRVAPKELPKLVERVAPFGETFIDRFELEDLPLAELLDQLDADGLYPFYREGAMAGIIVLGQRGMDRQMGREERELLAFVGHSLADAIHKNALVEQKVSLEREIARTERMSSLGRLAAGVAHEIKNPLSTIKSIIDVMHEEVGDDGDLKEDLEVISEEIVRLDDTVKNLLEFIRPDERRDRLISVESVVAGVLHILDYEARKTNVVIATRLSEKTHYVRGVAEELKSIFFNLVINAIEAMEKTGGTLTVTTRALDPELEDSDGGSRRVEVCVQDTGPGIPEDRQEQVFRPFYTEGKAEGTGLGLAIVRQKVSACQGEIDFETGDWGTRFLVRLPVAGRDPKTRRGKQPESEPPLGGGGRETMPLLETKPEQALPLESSSPSGAGDPSSEEDSPKISEESPFEKGVRPSLRRVK